MSAIDSIMRHLHYLADQVGPRGSTTPKEAEAADYAETVYRQLGLRPVRQPVTSARSAWHGYGLGAGIFLLAEVALLAGGRIGAAVAALMALVALVSLLLELYFTSNPLRWFLPKGPSQNVYAVIPPRGEVRQKLVIVGHLDTHRTPLVFSSRRWLFAYRWLTLVGIAAVVVNTLLYLYIVLGGPSGVRLLTIPPSGALTLFLLMSLQADSTEYSTGANDNGTGAAMVFGLAERLVETPLAHTEVWALSSGCEEVGCYGADTFLRENRDELGEAYFLTIDSVGGPEADLTYFTRQALIYPFHSDPQMLALAGRVTDEHPELGARGVRMVGARTEGALATKHGLRSLSIVNLAKTGIVPPHWHQPSDVVENIDTGLMVRTERFTWELIQALDQDTA